jgi:ribosomal protein S18 acetylase RimI-like enzyme
MTTDLLIEPLPPERFADIWPIIEAVVRPGDTYTLPRDMTFEQARAMWTEPGRQVFVARGAAGAALGTYFLKPNRAGPGAHVANAGYMVAPEARGRGVASAMCVHSLEAAKTAGYRAMQFNMVVSTNARAVALWRRHGFDVLCALPGAFNHPTEGYVDAFLMFRSLD